MFAAHTTPSSFESVALVVARITPSACIIVAVSAASGISSTSDSTAPFFIVRRQSRHPSSSQIPSALASNPDEFFSSAWVTTRFGFAETISSVPERSPASVTSRAGPAKICFPAASIEAGSPPTPSTCSRKTVLSFAPSPEPETAIGMNGG